MLTEQDGVLGIECDGRFIPAISGGAFGTTASIIITVVSIALSIAAAAVQYMQAQQAAKQQQENQQRAMEVNARNQEAQMRAQEAAIAANAALANRNYMEQTKALQERQRQSDEVAANKQQDVAVAGAQARSTALTAAGEAGVSGLSVNALLDDFTRQEVDYRFQSSTQLGYEHDQTQNDIEAAQITAEGRTQSMKPYQYQEQSYNPVQFPSLLGAGLRLGADVGSRALSAYNKKPSTPETDVPRYQSPSDRLGVYQ